MRRVSLHQLGLPLLAAMALHGLWLAGTRLPQTRATDAAKPAAMADNTPELVRVARRLTLEHSLRVATPLPPPPVRAMAPRAPALPSPVAASKPPGAAAKPKASPATRKSLSQQRTVPKRPATTRPDTSLVASVWATAQPVDDAPGPLATLPAVAQLRQIGQDDARRLGLNEAPTTPQIQGGDLVLTWIQGGEVWLLRLPLPRP